ncbi:DsbA family oxidoreductase [Lacrimispora sp.]|uniref:DsbA family oxidoreductase n=1 Tax=Lacrimispora sp. TaxID=2719234 RepID=UPI002FDA48CF
MDKNEKKKVEVFFDYICPFCYAGLKYFEDLLPEYNIEIEWRAVEAHPKSEPPHDLSGHMEAWERKIRPMVLQAGLELNAPVSPAPRSDKAFEAMHYIIDHQGNVEEYHKNMFRTMFVDQKDLEDISVILTCAQDCGINLSDLETALKNGTYSGKQQQALSYAYGDNEIAVVPTFISGSHRLDAVAGVGVTKEQVKEFLDSLYED